MDTISAIAVSPAQAAILIGISRSKLYEIVGEELPLLKIGRRSLLRVADIERYLEKLSTESGH